VRVANLALVVALVAGIAVNWSTIVSLFGSKTLLASVVIVVVALVLGLLVAVKEPTTRVTTGLVSGLRVSSLGLIIIGRSWGGTPTTSVPR
jgi:hypothetical protein